MPMEHQQLLFDGGANPSAPAHAIKENEVQSASNIDFGLERGAAMARRGIKPIGGSSPHAIPVIKMYRHFTTGIGNSKLFFLQTDVITGTNASYIIMGTPSGGTYGLSALSTGAAGNVGAFASYKDTVLIGFGAGTKNIKHDGTNVSEWFKQAPGTALTVNVATLSPVAVSTVYPASEGTAVATSGTGTYLVDAETYRLEVDPTLLATNLSTNGTNAIGDYGVIQTKLAFSNPSMVLRVSLDFSIDDNTFASYWHTEMTLDDVKNAAPSYQALMEAQATDYSGKPESLISGPDIKGVTNKASSVTRISAVKDDLVPWRVPVTDFEFIGQTSGATSALIGWTDIQACRLIIEADDAITVYVAGISLYGAETYPLNDTDVGYAWWQTWAKVDSNGVITSESAPGPISTIIKCQNALATLTGFTSPTGSATLHDITHRCFYRQGGYLSDAYYLGSCALASTSFIDNFDDISVLSTGIVLNKNIYSNADAPGNILAISEPYQSRVFIAMGNKLMWSVPGKPDVFPKDSYTYVSHSGDEIRALICGGAGLVIINRDSVYELSGTVFEGINQDWVLQRTAAKTGSKPRNGAVVTPYGITLLDYDGLYMYVPGQGVAVQIPWVQEKLADVFLGTAATDPAALKGTRVPAFNKPYILDASIAYANNRIYMVLPTGSGQAPDTVFVLDMLNQTCWWYPAYGAGGYYSFYCDMEDNRLLVGGDAGTLYQIETGMQDLPATPQAKVWSIKTRAWTTPNDTVLENIQCEYVGDSATFAAYFDGGSQTVLHGSMTSTTKDYFTAPMNGTIASNVVFEVFGTTTATTPSAVYGISWDALVDPPRVKYWRTESDINNYDGEKLWNVQFSDIESFAAGTITAVTFVDGAAIMTNTIVSTATGIKSRDIYPFTFPAETYGDIAYTTYTATSTQLFKHWKTRFDATNEPPRVNYWKSPVTSLDENICDAVDVDINPNGTATSIVYVDNTAVGTYSNTGTKRQSYTNALPNETYGRTIYATYSGSAFKHYNTWFHLRKEPDRWTNFVSDKQSGEETYYKNFNCTINCLGGTTTATVMLDAVAIDTFTFTGSTNQSYVKALAQEKFGRTIWAIYTTTTTFKHYATWFDGEKEPPKVNMVQAGPFVYPSEQYLKTWIAVLNPNGTCTGTLYGNSLNGGTRTTLSIATFTGINMQTYNSGLETAGAESTANYSDLFVVYTGTNLKHYDTKFELEAHPFKKLSWAVIYRKIGGVTRLDQARFLTLDYEMTGLGTLTSTWFADGTACATHTLTATNSNGRNYIDMEPIPPGVRGYEFSQYISSTSAFSIWRSTLDIMRTGVKGYSRISLRGRPVDE